MGHEVWVMEVVEENPMTVDALVATWLTAWWGASASFPQLQSHQSLLLTHLPRQTGSNAGWVYTLDPVQRTHTSLYSISSTLNIICSIKVAANMFKAVIMKMESFKLESKEECEGAGVVRWHGSTSTSTSTSTSRPTRLLLPAPPVAPQPLRRPVLRLPSMSVVAWMWGWHLGGHYPTGKHAARKQLGAARRCGVVSKEAVIAVPWSVRLKLPREGGGLWQWVSY